ncbi:MAG: hypothetical protein Q8M16_08170 [Pirellulaceae bacterium]|nr:hypothetical protein [Pirellulaceae bacterium]
MKRLFVIVLALCPTWCHGQEEPGNPWIGNWSICSEPEDLDCLAASQITGRCEDTTNECNKPIEVGEGGEGPVAAEFQCQKKYGIRVDPNDPESTRTYRWPKVVQTGDPGYNYWYYRRDEEAPPCAFKETCECIEEGQNNFGKCRVISGQGNQPFWPIEWKFHSGHPCVGF